MRLLWVPLLMLVSITVHAQNWQVTGNPGLNSNNFLGTTTNIPLQFKVNNNPAGYSGGDNNWNVSFGYWSLPNRSSGQENAAFGYNTLNKNTTGYENTAIGHNAMFKTTTGRQNTAVGSYSLINNTTGYSNVAIGSAALYLSTTANYNVAIGNNALRSVTTSSPGAIGGGDYSSYNVAVGVNAMQYSTTGNYNTAIGYQSLLHNNTGYWNTGIGAGVLQYNSSGFFNTAVGVSALHYNTTGEQNTAVGEESMAGLGANSQTGSYNTAVGLRSLDSNNTGSNNTAIGYRTLDRNKTGNNNTAVGLYADVLQTGLNNISLLGMNSKSAASNTTTLGFGAVTVANNQVRLGNSSITKVGAYANWSTPADSKIDKDIRGDIPGLAFIEKLNPVTYTVDIDAADQIEQGNKKQQYSGTEATERATRKKQRISGFVAQEVEKVADSLGYDFSGIAKPANSSSLYALEYATFVVPLAKSVQELSAKNKQQDSTIQSLQQQLTVLQQQVQQLLTKTSSTIGLQQNAPNPFSANTSITYSLPETFSNAYITITDMNGTVLKKIDLAPSGKGTYRLEGNNFTAGVYFYSLVIDGKKIDSKKMVVAK